MPPKASKKTINLVIPLPSPNNTEPPIEKVRLGDEPDYPPPSDEVVDSEGVNNGGQEPRVEQEQGKDQEDEASSTGGDSIHEDSQDGDESEGSDAADERSGNRAGDESGEAQQEDEAREELRICNSGTKLNRNNKLPLAVQDLVRKVIDETGWDGRCSGGSDFRTAMAAICSQVNVDHSNINDDYKSSSAALQNWLSAVKRYAYRYANPTKGRKRPYIGVNDVDPDETFAGRPDPPVERLRKRPNVNYHLTQNGAHADDDDDNDDHDDASFSGARRYLPAGTLGRMQSRANAAQRGYEMATMVSAGESDSGGVHSHDKEFATARGERSAVAQKRLEAFRECVSPAYRIFERNQERMMEAFLGPDGKSPNMALLPYIMKPEDLSKLVHGGIEKL